MAEFMVPRLTTVYQEKFELGRMAFQRIRERILQPGLPTQRVMLPTRLVIRESCGEAPSNR
jgi:LacI family transcriptional regulator